MRLSERAKSFAIRSCDEQFRRNKSDISCIFHDLMVGFILERYGFDDKTVAAGYLHDITDKTDFNNGDIARLFGGEVASLVMTAGKADDSLPWEERTKQEIKALANMPERNAAIICADKIADIQSLRLRMSYGIDFEEEDHSFEEEKMYLIEFYKALAKNLQSSILDSFYEALNDLLENKSELPIVDYVSFYKSNLDLGYQEQLIRLKKVVEEKKPYIIKLYGIDKNTRLSTMRLFKEFFDSVDYRVRVKDNEDSHSRYEQDCIGDQASISSVEKHLLISSAIKEDYMQRAIGDQDVMIVEESLFNMLLYVKILIDRGQISDEDFEEFVIRHQGAINDWFNYAGLNYTSQLAKGQETAILDEETVSNIDSIINNTAIVDTTNQTKLLIVNTLLPIMSIGYLQGLKMELKKED